MPELREFAGSARPNNHEVLGSADAGQFMTLTVRLRPHVQHDSTDHLHPDLSQRVYLSDDDAVDIYRANDEDIAALAAFAVESNLTIVEINRQQRFVKLRGVVAAIQRAFGVELKLYRTEAGESYYIGRDGSFSLPEHLHVAVTGVYGLDSRPIAKPHLRMHPNVDGTPAALWADQIAGIYQFPQTASPAPIAFIELGGGYSDADNATAAQSMGLPPLTVSFIGVDGATNAYSGNANSADGEVALDVQVALGAAPGAPIFVVTAPNTGQGFIDAIAAAIHMTPRPAAISISWGSPEDQGWDQQTLNEMDGLFAQAATLGIAVFAASGDNGSSDGVKDGGKHVDFPASAPNCTGCGGTELYTLGGAYGSETTWNDQPQGGGAAGGGVSTKFSRPAYQSGLQIAGSGRCVPDVSAAAAPASGYKIVIGGQVYAFGGTSAVAPLWGALVSILTGILGKPVGAMNPILYALSPSPLHDIQSGSNGDWSAGPGYDCVTGLGSPIGTSLATAMSKGGGGKPKPHPISVTITRTIATPTVGQAEMFDTTTVPAPTRAFTWAWDFGDGVTATGSPSQYAYPKAGQYTVTCTVSDGVNAGTGSTQLTVTAAVAPPPKNSNRFWSWLISEASYCLSQHEAVRAQQAVIVEQTIDAWYPPEAAARLAPEPPLLGEEDA